MLLGSMAQFHYKEYTIVNTGRPSGSAEDPVGFIPVAVITWQATPYKRAVHFVKFSELRATAEEARATAAEAAKAWVDNHSLRYER
ncbi:MAG TPA: hypothetical protein VHM64_01350 [Candidatus Binatia bacterium]|nr:hypothetical protein [Candidatus Binatia bacterium]